MAFLTAGNKQPVKPGVFIDFDASPPKPTTEQTIDNIVNFFTLDSFPGMLSTVGSWWNEAEVKCSMLREGDTMKFPFTVDSRTIYCEIPALEVFDFLSKLYQRLEEIIVGEVRHIDDKF